MNLAELRSQVVTLTGYPERGKSGSDRVNLALNYALRQLWRDMPEALLKEEYRFRLETQVDTNTLTVDSSDPKVFKVDESPTTLDANSFATDGTLRGRWLEITKGGQYYYRRVRDVYTTGGSTKWYIVVDEPWDNLSDSGLTYKIFTKEYPYPSDLQKVRKVYYDPENNPYEILFSLSPEEMGVYRLSDGYRRVGRPDCATRGDFYSMPSPHYTPTVSTETGQAVTHKWGHAAEISGAEDTTYGPAGQFSYKVMHVWGRRPFLHAEHGRPQDSSKKTLLPFYQSSPSGESEKVSTTWGGGAIKIVTPDIDYMAGYGNKSSAKSYHKHGVEKWIFRARHSVDTTTTSGSGSDFNDVEADGVYYLWKIVEGHEATSKVASSVYDRGQEDPVDKNVVLKDVHGHFHIRFNCYPDSSKDVMLSVVRRPDTLKYDTDVSRVPPECYGALIDLTCSYLLGRRDGEPQRETYYYARYVDEVDRMRRLYTFSGQETPAFGDGLSGSRSVIFPTRDVKLS